MSIRYNAGYNSPEIAAVAQNIASMFGPPSASDLAGYSTARKNNQEVDQRAQLAQIALDPTSNWTQIDRAGLGLGGWAPNQSFEGIDRNNATQRYGYDTQAATQRANNAHDNRTKLISNMFGALNEGQVRPTLPGDIASSFGLPELPEAAGLPKPRTQAEVLGGQTQRLIDEGQINDQMLVTLGMKDAPVENIVGPDGKAIIQYRDQAVGAEPYFNPGAEAKPTNGVAVLRDGKRVPAVQNMSTGRWTNTQTGQELPADIQIFAVPQAQGSAEEIGMVSRPTGSQIEQQLIDIAVAKDTAQSLRTLIAESPASQGAVGWLRGTAQNVIQTGGELGTFFGGGVAEVMADIEGGLADQNLAGAFDPNIPAIEMMANLLAFQYAKTTTGERLSNEMLQQTRKALGLDGLTANQASSLARLDQAIAQIESQEEILRTARTGGVDAIGGAAVPGAPVAGRPPAAAGSAPVPQTQAEYDALPSGAVYVDPDDGKQYRKP